ncbi:MAG TPA: 3-hydroxyacyl-CoA dehydrogenase family protein [Planctomycetota bacterium]|nr:3-hydroxyacyl-CoA dehydrogenase family protein [Planctomycetota bacterium]
MIVSANDVRRAVVLGAGTMGHGIAQVAAAAGIEVRLYDVKDEFVQRGLAKVKKFLEDGVAKGKVAAEERDRVLGRLSGTTDLDGAAREADLAIEAIPEDLELKRRTFARLDEVAPEGALLATNTSSLPVTAIAAATRHPGRVVGMHFFNPPPLMKLVEVVRGEATDPAAVEAARGIALRMGNDPIVVRDAPGFASSRLGIALGLEAIRMLEQGVASAEDIDKAMELGYKHPMGPLKLTDLVGLDVRLAIAEYLERELGERFRAPELLRKMVREGKLGKKSGEGFYKY